MKSVISAILAISAFAADHFTKKAAEEKLAPGETVNLAGEKLQLRKTVNRGFAMNTFESKRKLVVGVSAVIFAMCAFMYCLSLCRPSLKHLRIGLGLLLGGAAGNTYDRLCKGYVVDFIYTPLFKKIIFNLSDIFIVVGALITLLGELTAGE